MCGIAGFAGAGYGRDENRRVLRNMCGSIRHRGPDDDGYFVAEDVAIGMRRLSIIDLTTGAQPVGNEDGSVQVVFNGEIYNYRSLRSHLEHAGHRLSTAGDTETIVHLYEDRGADLVHSLRGMFGFAVWDQNRRELLLARDRLGIKPLYYRIAPAGIAFASELRALLHLPDFRTELDPAGLASYLAFGYVEDPLTIFRDVRKLAPGHRLIWSAESGARVERYWTPVPAQLTSIDGDTAADELRTRIADAVSCHMEADVPVGVFLSGGLDSSSVAATVRQLGFTTRTFSIGFADQGYNEAPDAARVAAHLGTEHTEFIIDDCPDILDEVIGSFDEPFADSSAIPTLIVSQLARQHVKVVLSGDGGDELLGGYTRYLTASKQTEVRPAWLRRMAGSFGRSLPFGTRGRNQIMDYGRSRRGRYTAMVAKPLAVKEGGIARGALIEGAGAFEDLLNARFDDVAHHDFTTQMMLVDISTYLPGDILTKVDRASMATSLEARVPLLDHELVEFAAALPPDLKIRGGEGKWLLRQAIADLVPREVLEKRKQGFAVPVASWFRDRLGSGFEDVLRHGTTLDEYIDWTAAQRMYAEHVSGRRDHASRLWRLFVLTRWLRNLEDGRLARSTELDIDAMLPQMQHR